MKKEFDVLARISLLFVAILPLVFFTSAHADFRDNPDALPGWTHGEALENNVGEKNGIVLIGNDVIYSSPVVADIDGNPSNGLETAVGSADGTLSVYRSDGLLLWTRDLPNKKCKFSGSTNKLLSSPAVGDLFGRGMPHVVVGYGGVGGPKCDGGVTALRGSDGKTTWNFGLKKFAKKAKFGTNSHAVFSSPALADTDGDGQMEIGFGSFDRNVYLLNANGSVRWYYNAADTIWSSPAFANVDNDRDLEMIIGTDISANSRLRPPTKDGGYVYAFKTAKRKKKHISFRDSSAYVYQTAFDQVIYSSPVVADVLASSPGNEIIVGSGCFFPQRGSNKRGKWVKILRASNGAVLETLPIPTCSTSTPAIGDIDDDGVLEIVITVNGAEQYGGDGFSRIMAFKADSATPLWSVIPYDRGRNDEFGGNFMSPVIADVDGNGSLEVVAANGASVSIFNGRDGTPLTCQDRSCDGTPFTLYAGETIRSTPAIADLNGDGILDVVAAGGTASSRNGGLYGWTNLHNFISSSAGIHPPYSAPWPMYRGNARHTGR